MIQTPGLLLVNAQWRSSQITAVRRGATVALLRLLYQVCGRVGRAIGAACCSFDSHTLPSPSMMPFLGRGSSVNEALHIDVWLLLSAQSLFFQH